MSDEIVAEETVPSLIVREKAKFLFPSGAVYGEEHDESEATVITSS